MSNTATPFGYEEAIDELQDDQYYRLFLVKVGIFNLENDPKTPSEIHTIVVAEESEHLATNKALKLAGEYFPVTSNMRIEIVTPGRHLIIKEDRLFLESEQLQSTTQKTQHILLSVGIEYSPTDNKDIQLEARAQEIEFLVRNAIEHMRKESALSPPDLATNWITVDTDRVDEQQSINISSKVFLEGKLQTRKWQTKDGQDKHTTEVVVDMNGQMLMLDTALYHSEGTTVIF